MSDKIETSPVDNGFEKVDALAAEEPTSTTAEDVEPSVPEADMYTTTTGGTSSEAEPTPTANLLDLDEQAPPPPQPSAPEPEPEPALPDSATAPAESSDVASPGSCSGAWLKNIDPREHEKGPKNSFVLDLIYWRDIKKTAVVFSSMFVLLLSLAMCSVLSVIAYLSLAALTVTVSFVVYKKVLQAVQKTGDGHPFKQYLDVDVGISESRITEVSDMVAKHLMCTCKQLRRLFLVEDMVDSLKFGLLLWVLTYIGAWFNGMTLIILGIVGVFTLPKVYETYKVQIDHYIGKARSEVEKVVKQVQEKIPMPGKKKQS